METVRLETAVLDEQIWRAWAQKGKRREQATARRARLLAGAVAAIVAVAGAIYFFATR
jgi:hypothetical protein